MKRFAKAYILFFITVLLALSSSAAGQVQVSSANPNAAEQGTVNLNVTISGKGFKNGARTQWFVTGSTNPGGVVVNSTAFVNSTTLTANITVSDTADISTFDIQVQNSDGRIGKGTEIFSVVAKGTSTAQEPLQVESRLVDAPGHTIQSDGQNGGLYVTLSSAKVTSVVYSGSGDWELDTQTSQSRKMLVVLNQVTGDTSTPPFQAAVVPARILNCSGTSTETDSFFAAFPGGPSIECNFNLRFVYSRKEYRLQMNGLNGTSRTSVICTSSGTECRSWRSSAGTPEVPAIAQLQSAGKNGTWINIGLYQVTYAADIVWP